MPGRYVSVIIRHKVFVRAEGRCEYCRCSEKYALHTFHIEHIHPFSKGGKTILENLALACDGCNKRKTNKILFIDPLHDEPVVIFNPRTDPWNEHFKWSNDTLQIIGLTAIGRATIDCLKLNRKGVVNIRRLTIMSGEHPPKDE